MSTTYTVQELAQRYAEALVEYHTAQQSAVCAPIWVSEARDAMYAAEQALDAACQRQAQMDYA